MQKTLTIEECSQIALKLLEDAERKFESGDITQASIKFWDATTSVVSAAGEKFDRSFESVHDRKKLVEWIASEAGNGRLATQYSAIEIFYLRVKYDLAEDFQLDSCRPIAHKFVKSMLTLLQE